MILLVSLNLTGYVQSILCVESLVDILLHQSGTFFVIWYFDSCIDCIVFFWFVCLSVSTHCCVNKDYRIACCWSRVLGFGFEQPRIDLDHVHTIDTTRPLLNRDRPQSVFILQQE